MKPRNLTLGTPATLTQAIAHGMQEAIGEPDPIQIMHEYVRDYLAQKFTSPMLLESPEVAQALQKLFNEIIK